MTAVEVRQSMTVCAVCRIPRVDTVRWRSVDAVSRRKSLCPPVWTFTNTFALRHGDTTGDKNLLVLKHTDP